MGNHSTTLGQNYYFPKKLQHSLGLSENEIYIECYSCALFDKILIQGHIYIMPNGFIFHSLFNSRTLFGETNIIIKICDIICLEKTKGALGLNNSIYIETNQNQFKFTSFISREDCYDLLFLCWWDYLDSRKIVVESIKKEEKSISALVDPSIILEYNHTKVISNKEVLPNEEPIRESQIIRIEKSIEKDELKGLSFHEMLALRTEKISKSLPNLQKYANMTIRVSVSNTSIGQVFDLLFSSKPLKIKGKDFFNGWDLLVKRSGVKESPIVTNWNQNPPDFKNIKEILDLDDIFLTRNIKNRKYIKGAAALLVGKVIEFEEIQKLYVFSNRRLIITTELIFISKVPFSDTFEFKGCWEFIENENDMVTLEYRYYIEILKPSFIKGLIEKNSEEEQKEFVKILEIIIEDAKEAGLFEKQ